MSGVVTVSLASPITGWLTDKFGAEWIATSSMILAIPWWGIVTIDGSLAFFGIAFALESELIPKILKEP
jgi:hypothetical protein